MCKLLDCHSRLFANTFLPIFLFTSNVPLTHPTYTIPELASDSQLSLLQPLLLRCPFLHLFLVKFYSSWTLDCESIPRQDRITGSQISPITRRRRRRRGRGKWRGRGRRRKRRRRRRRKEGRRESGGEKVNKHRNTYFHIEAQVSNFWEKGNRWGKLYDYLSFLIGDMFQAIEKRERIQVGHSSLTELMRQRLEHREDASGSCGQS